MQRFWSKVKKTKKCWNWIYAKDKDGYGVFLLLGINFRAHRFSYELNIGPIPKRALILHKCDNPSCVRPDHLFPGSQKENINDCIKKGRFTGARGETHGHTTLTNSQIIKIRKDKRMHRIIAKEYSVHQSTISRIKLHETWNHI